MSSASKYVSFSEKEKKEVLFISLISACVLFFFAWNQTDYTLASGVADIVLFIFISLLSFFVFVFGTKYFATFWNYTADYKGWIPGSLIGFAVAFTSSGYLPVIFPGYLEFNAIDKLRHGQIFAGENKSELKTLLLIPVFGAIILAFFFQIILLSTNVSFFYYAMMLNAFIAFFALLPIPNNLGPQIFYLDRSTYFIMLFFTFLLAVLMLFEISLAIFVALFLAIVFFILLKRLLKKSDFKI